MSAVDEIGAVVDAAYRFLGFAAGDQPRWQQFGALFTPTAVLALRVFPDDEAISVMNLHDYAEAQMRHGLRDLGYTETPGDRTVDVVGAVAVVRQDFTMDFPHRPAARAVDVFSLAAIDHEWRIIAVVSDVSAPRAVTTGRSATGGDS
ncbi:hypothetical protein ACFVVM_09675 [Nocardia sp. NPDC058176]|uniref:hypothetical protein n=1 Tax=Nocardia sp. NPDC058176 TaxID=3346368 RepID=UPI0036D88DF6